MTRTQRIERAAASIGAERVSRCRWQYRDDATRRDYLATTGELLRLARYMDDPRYAGDAYSHWCAATTAREVTR